MYRSEVSRESRHVRILELALSGASRKQMAEELPISTASISRYLSTERVQDELDACRAAIVAKALQSFEAAFSLALDVYREQMESQFTSREAKLRAATQLLKVGARVGLSASQNEVGSPPAVVIDSHVDSHVDSHPHPAGHDQAGSGHAAAIKEMDFHNLGQGGQHEVRDDETSQ